MRLALSLLGCVFVTVGVLAQTATLKLDPVERQMPAYILERLNAKDRMLFDKLMRVGLESAWSLVTAEGYPQNFINELSPLKANTRMVGRARTMRYLPNRKDVRDKLYAAGPQLNYKSAEEAQPGDVLVFDAGGETRAGVSGGVTTIRFLVRGGAGLVIDGAMRDVPELEAMPIQTYMRRGHASSVAPLMMSVDYQVPVRIGSVTVIPGDILVGREHRHPRHSGRDRREGRQHGARARRAGGISARAVAQGRIDLRRVSDERRDAEAV